MLEENEITPLPVVVAETVKFLGNSSYYYQIGDWSRRRIKNYLNEEKLQNAVLFLIFIRKI